ncbi:MAG: peptidylprolyl isomerase [Verrucomicrobiales bacterium]
MPFINFAKAATSRSLYVAFTAAIACSCAKGDPKEDADKKAAANAPAKTAPTATSNPVVEIITSKGAIQVELNREKAPISVANFLSYVADKHYDGTIFHRVIKDFMIQGGCFAKGDVPAQKKSKEPIKNEAKTSGLSNMRGTISMARTNSPDSATAQFFINVFDNKNLDPGGFSPDGYAVFGKVIAGMDTVDKIRAVKTGTMKMQTTGGLAPMDDAPLEPVVIESISLKK